MKIHKKLYIPVTVEEAAYNGTILIATGKGTVTDDKAKFEICHQHLKEIEGGMVLTAGEFFTILNLDEEEREVLKKLIVEKNNL